MVGIVFAVQNIILQDFQVLLVSRVGLAALVELSAWGLRVFTLAIIPLAVQYARVDGLTALARTKTSLALSLFRKGSFVLLTLILPVFGGARAAFYAEPLADTIAACVSGTVFLLVFEKHLRRREQQAKAAASQRAVPS